MTNHPNRPTREGWDLHRISPEELREVIDEADRVCRARWGTRFSQADAGRRMHASPRTVRQWLAGDRAIPLTASETLALSLMWPGQSRVIEPSLALVERWLRPQFAGLILTWRSP